MPAATESPLLSPEEMPAARVLNADGCAPAVLVCEHASRFIPAALNCLGIDRETARSHAAWDIGALDLARALMTGLDAPLVAARVSRLVYDCNRPPDAPGAVPERVEEFDIPGNQNLNADQLAARSRDVYDPFRAVLGQVLDRHSPRPTLITIHSFTPIYFGHKRDVELGILHDDDDRMARALLAGAQARTDLRCAINEPYSAKDGVTHTLREQATTRGLPNVMIEVRNDLVDSPAGVARIAGLLEPVLSDVIGQFAQTGAHATTGVTMT